MMSDEGATPAELVLEASRRNNTDLLREVFDQVRTAVSKSRGKRAEDEIAKILNRARDPVGNGVLHLAAANGNYEVLDLLLDQEGVEIEEVDRMEKDTPLHKAVRFTNELDPGKWSIGHDIVHILLDAGCDARIKNKAKLKPSDLADPRNKELRTMLRNAEYSMHVGDDVVHEDEDGEGGSGTESD